MQPDCNRIRDERKTSIIVLSDLHKYSGVSTFSKGYDPNFSLYYALYKEHALGEIDAPVAELSKKQKRTIEARVREGVPQAEIEIRIAAVTPSERARREKEFDPHGYWRRRQEVFDSFQKAGHVVFNGDIFDIQCSEKPHEKIIEAADWLKKRMDAAPDTQFHFVLGNHEAYPEFIAAMNALERDPHYGRQFSFHEHFLQINDSLFIHGDDQLDPGKYRLALEGYASTEMGARTLLKELRTEFRSVYESFGGWHHALHNLHEGLEKMTAVIARELAHSRIPELAESFGKSRHIFSGHIHEPYAAERGNKYYYNTGAAVNSKMCPFKPLTISMDKGRTLGVNALLASDLARAPHLLIEDANPPQNPLSYQALVGCDNPQSIRKWGIR